MHADRIGIAGAGRETISYTRARDLFRELSTVARMVTVSRRDLHAALARVERLLARWSNRVTTEIATTGDDSDVPELAGMTHMRRVYGLSRIDCDILLLALAVELDPGLARLLFGIAAPRSALTVGTLVEILAAETAGDLTAIPERLAEHAPLRRFALIELETARPFSQRELACPELVWRRLIGQDTETAWSRPASPPRSLEELALSDATRRAARRAIGAIERGETRVVVRGAPGSGRTALARAIASGAGLASLEFLDRAAPSAVIAREAHWHHAAVICNADVARDLEIMTPVIVVFDADVPADLTRAGLEVAIDPPTASDRAALWRALLPPDVADVDVGLLAQRHRLGPGRIRIAIERASSDGLADDAPLQTATLERACHSISSASFAGLAHRMPCPYDLEDIVVPGTTRQELDLAIAWASQGPGVTSAFHEARGLACLFHGPPGTGKSMAAQIIARRLERDIYRIDLSQVVNKYIGETEKNLARLFDEAGRRDVVLFFDEADALFGARTDVKTAHDRYASVETGYLLQRLEEHDGVVILATNLRHNLDSAFARRLQVVATFPMPGPKEQQLIWDRRLPAERDADIDLTLLSNGFSLAGGDIRNAALTAAVLASSEGASVGMRHVVSGVVRELRKAGRMIHAQDFGPWQPIVLDLMRTTP